MNKLQKFSTFIFDCDGVILNSNKIKTQAFYDVAKIYGHEPAHALKQYHVQNGGISRYKKFEYFLATILKKKIHKTELDDLLLHFAEKVKNALLTCEVVKGLDEFRANTPQTKWLVVSGGDQAELREVFAQRGLDKLFDGGIFGSPDTKDTILEREIKNRTIVRPSLFLGDSKYDYQAATHAGLDFVFIGQWTEIKDWHGWATDKGIACVLSLLDLTV